jgi:hypothetical protein
MLDILRGKRAKSGDYTKSDLGEPPEGSLEVVINAIRKAAPRASIAFNTRPDDSADAAARWVPAP